jgi:hypothetical protein
MFTGLLTECSSSWLTNVAVPLKPHVVVASLLAVSVAVLLPLYQQPSMAAGGKTDGDVGRWTWYDPITNQVLMPNAQIPPNNAPWM